MADGQVTPPPGFELEGSGVKPPPGFELEGPTHGAGGSYEPDGFLSSLGHSISNTLHNNVQGYLHAGPGQASEVQPTFNPLHPIETAGYLVPQPIKDIAAEWGGNKPAAIGHAVGEAAPYVLGIPSPEGAAGMAGDAGSALVRGGAKTANAMIHNAPAIGSVGGGLAGLAKHGDVSGALVGGYFGKRLGDLAQKIPDVPGERFGLPEPADSLVHTADRPGTHLRIGQPDEVPGGVIRGNSTLSRAAYLSRNPLQATPEPAYPASMFEEPSAIRPPRPQVQGVETPSFADRSVAPQPRVRGGSAPAAPDPFAHFYEGQSGPMRGTPREAPAIPTFAPRERPPIAEPESVKPGNPTPFTRSAAAGAEDFGRQGSTSEQLAGSKPGISKGRMAEQLRGENSPFGSRFKSTVEAPEEEDLSPWGGTFKKKEGR